MKNGVASTAAVFLLLLLVPASVRGQDISRIWNRAVGETREAEDLYRRSSETLGTLGWDEVRWSSIEEATSLLTRFAALRERAREGAALAAESQAAFRKATVSWECVCEITRDTDPDNWATARYNAGVTADNQVKSGEMLGEYDRILALLDGIIAELGEYLAEPLP